MNVMTKRGTQDNVVTYEHFCDSVEDMSNIDPKYITLGSVCVVVSNSGLLCYIGDSNHNWHMV